MKMTKYRQARPQLTNMLPNLVCLNGERPPRKAVATGGSCRSNYKTTVLLFPVLGFWPSSMAVLGGLLPAIVSPSQPICPLSSQTRSSLPSPNKWGVLQHQSFILSTALHFVRDVPGLACMPRIVTVGCS